jgi:Polyketide cyclase / dehydrase and lipid transport
MRTWTATTTTAARPAEVLDVLTDPDACTRWAPIAFELEDMGSLPAPRLRAGTQARVNGRLAGRRVGFDVHVHAADERGLTLAADGPVGFDVAYELAPAGAGSEVRASVSVRPSRGLTGRLLAEATGALLSAGALDTAISRIGREAAACC